MRVDEERHIREDRIIPGIIHWPEKLCYVETFLYSKSKFSSHFRQSVQMNRSEKIIIWSARYYQSTFGAIFGHNKNFRHYAFSTGRCL